MSLDKAIKYGKEHRKPYTGGKAFDRSCRNHGTCSFCEGNRRFKFRDKHPEDIKEEEINYAEEKEECQKDAASAGESYCRCDFSSAEPVSWFDSTAEL